MSLGQAFAVLVDKSPVSVMVSAATKRRFAPRELDALF
jgi:hypothetical protein